MPYLWLRKDGTPWLLVPTVASLAMFVYLLSLHPDASGRVYAVYGGVYVVTALVWLRFVDGVELSRVDWIGACVSLLGMAILVSGWRSPLFPSGPVSSEIIERDAGPGGQAGREGGEVNQSDLSQFGDIHPMQVSHVLKTLEAKVW